MPAFLGSTFRLNVSNKYCQVVDPWFEFCELSNRISALLFRYESVEISVTIAAVDLCTRIVSAAAIYCTQYFIDTMV